MTTLPLRCLESLLRYPLIFLTYLVQNSQKSCRATITVTAERAERNVIIRFQNRGNDIPAEKLEALFDKFYRLDQARSTGTGGTDLGLAIAKEIVLLHGGSIQAFSENHTVTFTLCLPDGDS